MDTDRKWVVVRIDGKIAAISTDYRRLAEISAHIAKGHKKSRTGNLPYKEICATVVEFEEILKLKQSAKWEDMLLFGTEFQKRVWHRLWTLVHPEDTPAPDTKQGTTSIINRNGRAELMSYSDFAELCDNRAGVRAVAHAIGLNPLPVLIPCHLIVPKEAIDKISEIRRKAESTIFKGDDLCFESILSDQAIDFGEYALGRELKRNLIRMELA